MGTVAPAATILALGNRVLTVTGLRITKLVIAPTRESERVELADLNQLVATLRCCSTSLHANPSATCYQDWDASTTTASKASSPNKAAACPSSPRPSADNASARHDHPKSSPGSSLCVNSMRPRLWIAARSTWNPPSPPWMSRASLWP